MQLFLRRVLIKYFLPSYRNVWPVDPKSAKLPEGWEGWPENKRFALILTHDVDTQYGHDDCLKLAELEKRLDFRSSFNFVAEDFNVSRNTIHQLHTDGFEVGLHGIHHENPFKSSKKFPELAAKINQYLKEWNAVGFRSPSMYHNLDLMHYLNIEYDASLFDTDPFEPQPDGAGTSTRRP